MEPPDLAFFGREDGDDVAFKLVTRNKVIRVSSGYVDPEVVDGREGFESALLEVEE
jgi:hypothetical protein